MSVQLSMHRTPTFISGAGLLLLGLSACGSDPLDPDDDPDNQTIPTTCEATNTFELAVGEFVELRGNAAALVCMRAGGSLASYVLVATSAATSGAASSTFTFQASGTTQSVSPPTPVGPEPVAAPVVQAGGSGLVEDFDFHVNLREETARTLPALSGGTPPESPSRAAAAPPAVGQILQLNAQAASGQQCSNPIQVAGRVELISEKAIVVADTMNPSGGFSASDFQYFASFFDAHVSPLTEEYFGTVTDIDANQRTILLFTREVNRLTPAGSASYVGGFFHPRDLIAKAGCPTSNEGEILYLLVPDPNGTVNGNPRSHSFVLGVTGSTLTHEQQHLINASRRQLVLKLTGDARNEVTWLNEGLSHVSEELLFYRMAGREPESNLSANNLGPRISELNLYQAANFQRIREYLLDPSSSSPYHSTDGLDTRGASWSFLRYVVDRQPGGHALFLRNLVSSSTIGIENLSGAIGGTDRLAEWLADWAVALYADDRISTFNSSDRHRLRSWNQPTLINTLQGSGALGPECMPVPQTSAGYPICARSIPAGTTASVSLARGGSAYFRFGVDPETVGRVKVTPTSGGIAPPTTLRLTLLRTR